MSAPHPALPPTLEQISDALAKRGDRVVCAYVFGSVARDQAGPLSDIDVAVFFAPALDADARFALAAAIVSDLDYVDGRRVDLAILNDAPPLLAHRAISEGRILLSLDEAARVAFECRVISEYLDFQPVLARYDRALLARAAEGRLGS
jgi:hypothetical protein